LSNWLGLSAGSRDPHHTIGVGRGGGEEVLDRFDAAVLQHGRGHGDSHVGDEQFDQLEGKVIVEMIPGTFEQAVDPSSTWVDVVYAQHLLDLYDSGTIADAAIFPSVLRPWFVVFDGDAGTWVNDGDTEWYNTNHYLAVVTDAEDVTPALSDTAPTLADAQARVAELAADGASYVSTDWNTAPANAVLGEVLPRG
jgi:hypothetical protein